MSDSDIIKERMLIRIANTNDVYIKHLQLNEKDLSIPEKYSILENLFNEKPIIFLERYFNFLNINDISLFENLSNNAVADYYLKQIIKNHKLNGHPNNSKSDNRNKHFKILEQLIAEGEYFDDNEMKKRDPYLYEQMIGQFLDKEEIKRQASSLSTQCLSDNLFNQLQSMDNNQLYEKQLENEKAITEEYDSDDSENIQNQLSETENKELLRKEFISIMHERFLDGKDDFNYEDEKYNNLDPLEIMNRDKEDAYFDDDDDDNDDDTDDNIQFYKIDNIENK